MCYICYAASEEANSWEEYFELALDGARVDVGDIPLPSNASAFTETTDVGSSLSTAQTISVGEDVFATTASSADVDLFRVTLDAGVYSISMESSAWNGGTAHGDPLLALYTSGLSLITFDDDSGAGNDSHIYYYVDTTTTIHVAAFPGFGGQSGEYELSVQAAEISDVSILDAMDWNYSGATTINVYLPAIAHAITEISGNTSYTSEALNADELDAMMRAFQDISDVCNLSFNYVTSIADADFAMFASDDQSGFLGYWAIGGGQVSVDGTTYTLDGWGYFDNTAGSWDAAGFAEGGDGYVTIVHEILHGLGMAHPHDNGGDSGVMLGVSSSFGSYGYLDLNQQINTIMSYNRGWETGPLGPTPSDSYGGVTGPMALDIAYLQASYGANTQTNKFKNSYILTDLQGPGAAFDSIWDAGGVDWIKAAANSTTNVVIDLRPASITYDELAGGPVSYHEGVNGGFTIAQGVEIEKADGAKGDDILIGNDLDNVLKARKGKDDVSGGDGADTLVGGTGNDTLSGDKGDDVLEGGKGKDKIRGGSQNDTVEGGAGKDTFIMGQNWDEDLILDFETGVDTLEFKGNSGVTSLADLNVFDQSGDTWLVSLADADNRVIIQGGAGSFSTADIDFV